MQITIDPRTSKAHKALIDFKNRTLDKMKHNLDIELNKDSDEYRTRLERYEYLKKLYDVCFESNMHYVTVLAASAHVYKIFIDSNLYKSIDQGKIYNYQKEAFKKAWAIMTEVNNYFNITDESNEHEVQH